MAVRSTSATITVAFGARAWLRLFFYALLFIAPIAIPLALAPVAVLVPPSAVALRGVALVLTVAAVTFLTSVILPIVCLYLRHPSTTTVTLDAWGATEREGDDVRTAVPWSAASVYQQETVLFDRQRKRIGRRGAQIAARGLSGHVVYAVTEARISLFGAFARPKWAFRRRSATSPRWINELVYPFDRVESLTEPPLDPRDGRRGGRGIARFFGLLVLASLALAASRAPVAVDHHNERFTVVLCLGVAALFTLLRTLRPFLENRRLAREANGFRTARAFSLTGAADAATASAIDEGGTQVLLDLSAVSHPDAALVTRKTRVFAVTEGADGAGYRGGVARATAIETERDRRERARILRANRIELFMRMALFALMVVDAALWASGAMYVAFR